MALASGEDGLDHANHPFAEAREHLTDQGLLVVGSASTAKAWSTRFRRRPSRGLKSSAGDEAVFLVEAEILHA